MVLGMDIRSSKTTANKLGTPPSGLFGPHRGRHLENNAFPEGISSKHFFSMLFSTTSSNRIQWKISSITYFGFTPYTELLNIGFSPNRPLGACPTCLQWFLKTLCPYLRPCKKTKTNLKVLIFNAFLCVKSQFIGIFSPREGISS